MLISVITGAVAMLIVQLFLVPLMRRKIDSGSGKCLCDLTHFSFKITRQFIYKID
jgi:hypothetical protein